MTVRIFGYKKFDEKLNIDGAGDLAYNDGMKEALRQAVGFCSGYLISKQPSLGRVAVVAFYSNCDGDPKHMKCYCNRHAPHLLS